MNDEDIIISNNYKQPLIKPELKEGTKIYIENREHPLHLMKGVVIERDHRYYRINFENGMNLWCPEHWIEPLGKQI